MKNINLSVMLILFLTIVFAPSTQAQILELESTTEGFLPPRMTTTQRDAIPTTPASDGLIIFNISTGRINYYDGVEVEWLELYPRSPEANIINYFRSLPNGIQKLLDAGETPANILTAGAPTSEFIGLNYQGGIIFYMNPNNDGTGLVAAPTNQSGGTTWGCNGVAISGADGTAIGTGNQNTIDIEAGCTTTGTAADICANLVLGGFNDWFLPSQDELNEMYLNIGKGASAPNTNIGGFTDFFYWSSSETSDVGVWTQDFSNNTSQIDSSKTSNLFVRAIRAF